MKKNFYLAKLAVIFGLISVVGYDFTDIIHYAKYNLLYNLIEMLAYNSLLVLIIVAFSFFGLILLIKIMTLIYSKFSKIVFYLILAASYIYTLYFTIIDFSFNKNELTKILFVSLYYLIALTIIVLCTLFLEKIIRFTDRIIKFGFRLSCIILLILYLAFGVWSICNKFTNKTKPNVIIIMADTLRSDHLGCYGYKKITPNIDDFAKDANLYKRAIAQASITHLSVPSILSGKYPLSKDSGDRVMLHEVLKGGGYSTASIISNTACMSFDNFKRSLDYFDTEMCSKLVSSPGVCKKSINWIEKNKTKPFFLFAHFMDPHSPYIRHKEFNFDPDYKGVSADRVDIEFGLGSVFNSSEKTAPLSHIKAVYDSDVAFTDKYIGKLIDYLKKNNLYNNSIIVFVADHGEEFKDHGSYFHGKTLYNEVISVPLIIKTPNQKTGKNIEGTFSLINLYPSIIENLGNNINRYKLHGRPINLNNLKKINENGIYSYMADIASFEANSMKLIIGLSLSHSALFNLKKDPKEQTNLFNKEPALANQMLEILSRQNLKLGKSKDNADLDIKNLNKDQKDRMKALGYLGN